jgi:hypothetical protein
VRSDQPKVRRTIDCVTVAAGRDATLLSRRVQQAACRAMKITGKHFSKPVIVSTGLVVAGVSINSFIKDNDVRHKESSWTLFCHTVRFYVAQL